MTDKQIKELQEELDQAIINNDDVDIWYIAHLQEAIDYFKYYNLV